MKTAQDCLLVSLFPVKHNLIKNPYQRQVDAINGISINLIPLNISLLSQPEKLSRYQTIVAFFGGKPTIVR